MATGQTTTETKTTTTAAGGGAAVSQPVTTEKTTEQQTPSGVEIEVGIGSRIGGPAISNYKNNNGVLSLSNLGRATPQFLTGLGFSCETSASTSTSTVETATTKTETTVKKDGDRGKFCDSSWGKHLGVFVSAQFGSGSNQTISGYSVGMTYALGRYLRLLAGFSLTPVDEISPGFANAASQYVTKNATLFPGIDPAKLASNAYGAFDGIQATSAVPAAGATPGVAISYTGAITETHYRGGFLIGVALPINIYNLLGGNSKN